MTICPDTFRKTLGSFPTGVTVVTTRTSNGNPLGITISSFTSLSLEPAKILFCLWSKAHCLPIFKPGHSFAVNILSSHQHTLSDHFATPAEKRPETLWEDISTNPNDVTHPPLLKEAMGHVICEVDTLLDGGDHKIIVGKVAQLMRNEDQTQPLIRHMSCYKETSAL